MKTFEFKGKISTFGGPSDTGVDEDENLAFIHLDDLAEWRFNHLFLSTSSRNGLARRLDPEAFYIACRWDYSQTPKDVIRNSMVLVRTNDKAFWAQPADWGPHEATGRAMDLSPGLARALGLKTDDEAAATLYAPVDDSEEPELPPTQPTGKRVMLLVGHHPIYDGAHGSGTTEFTFNKDLVYRVAANVKKAQTTIYWREKSTWDTEQISRIVDSWEPEIVLEFHLNYYDGVSNQQGTGTEMLYISSKGKAIAQKLQEAAVGVLGLSDRGVKYRPNLTILKRSKAPAVILESGFIDEEIDMGKLTSKKDDLARAYAAVIDSMS